MLRLLPLPLIKKNMLCLCASPLYHTAALLLYLAMTVRFFVLRHFFVYGAGTSDLRQFFAFLPYPCIVLVPAVGLFVHHASTERGFDALLPYSELQKSIASIACATAGFLMALIPWLLIPAVVDLFGDADIGQFTAGAAGSLLFIAAACALCDFLYRLLDGHDALAFSLCALVMAVFSHIPKGFLWLCGRFASGMLSPRDAMFYIAVLVFFLFLSEAAQAAKKGRRFAKDDWQLLALELIVLVLLLIVPARLHSSADISRSKAFSVSSYSRALFERAQSPVRIQYFVSPLLRRQYPQIADVRDYLSHFADTVPNAVFLERNADKQETQAFLARMGVARQQQRTVSGNRTQYTDVYSAVVIEYLDDAQVIPFVAELQGLEYNIAARVGLLLGESRKVALLAGNGMSLESDYYLVAPWLSMQGFEIVPFRENGSGTLLAVLGSGQLGQAECDSVLSHIDSGEGTLLMLSAHDIDIAGSWEPLQVADDTLIEALADYGISFRQEFVADIANVPVELEESVPENPASPPERRLINYPLWISVMPQEHAPRGATLFWASPLTLSGSAEQYLQSSQYAWLHAPHSGTNPFLVEQSDAPAGAMTLAARLRSDGKNCIVVGDQYCLSTQATQYLNAQGQGDFRNFMFLADALLELNGEQDLLALKNRAARPTLLYKQSEPLEFIATAHAAQLILFVAVPALYVLGYLAALALRRRRAKALQKAAG